MYREIKKKKIILEYRKPFTKEVASLLFELDQADWIYSSIRLDGNILPRSKIERILKGDFVIDVSVSHHAAVSNHQQTIRMLCDMAEMDVYLSKNILMKMYDCLIKPPCLDFRKSNPVLHMLSYNPPHFKEIEEQIDLLFYWFYKDNYSLNPIERAALVHNKLIEIYPFESGSEAVARAAAQYILLQAGFPIILWNISEQEYYDAVSLYLKSEDITPIYEVLERGTYNKLLIMLQLTSE